MRLGKIYMSVSNFKGGMPPLALNQAGSPLVQLLCKGESLVRGSSTAILECIIIILLEVTKFLHAFALSLHGTLRVMWEFKIK